MLSRIIRRSINTNSRKLFQATAAFPTRGQGQGGHPVSRIKEEKFVKTWLSDPSAYPIMLITSSILLVAGYRLVFHDSQCPSIHYAKNERAGIDYLENKTTEDMMDDWNSHLWRQGPHKKLAPFTYSFTNCTAHETPDAMQRYKMEHKTE